MSHAKPLLLLLYFGLLTAGCDSANLSDVTEPNHGTDVLSKGVPANGNGNMAVDSFDEYWDLDCGAGKILNIHLTGWAQFKVFNAENRQTELDVWHISLAYSNSSGETFVWKDRGPDHYYVDANGDVIMTVTGRSSYTGVVGHVVYNLSTGEIELVAGNDYGPIDDLACESL
jgi:hypothetical protein